MSHSLVNTNLSKLDQTNESKSNANISSSSFSNLNSDDNNTLYLFDTSKAWSMLKRGESYIEEPQFLIHRIDVSKFKIEEEEEKREKSLHTINHSPSHNIEYLSVKLTAIFLH